MTAIKKKLNLKPNIKIEMQDEDTYKNFQYVIKPMPSVTQKITKNVAKVKKINDKNEITEFVNQRKRMDEFNNSIDLMTTFCRNCSVSEELCVYLHKCIMKYYYPDTP